MAGETTTAEQVHGLLAQGALDRAREVLREAFAAGAPADPAWARACEAAGLSELAVQAWRAVLAHHPDDPIALSALLALHELRGDDRRAAACRQALARLGAAAVHEAEPPPFDPAPDVAAEPTPGDLVRFVHLFSGRAGVHARMWRRDDQIGYAPVASGLEPGLVEAHLRGEVTVGSYLVRHTDVTGQIVLDLDVERAAVERAEGRPERIRDLASRMREAGVAMSSRLRAAGVPHLLVDSGYKGRHVWVFLDPPAPAGAARRVGLAWAAALAPADPELRIEVFPKQDKVEGQGLGNLVKLPMGVHLRTGRRCALLGEDGAPASDPWSILRGLRSVPLSAVPLPAGGVPAVVAPAAQEEERALPVVAAAPPGPFTEADLEARPRLGAVMSGCAVLRDVVRRGLADLRLSRDERLVLENTFGHWPEGVEAVNFVLDRVAAGDGRMGRPLQGNPTSCKGIRRRLSEVADRVGCDCPFDVPETYPHPLLHARGLPAAAPAPPPDLDLLLERLGRLESRAREVERELVALRQAAAIGLRGAPGGRHRTEDGAWWVEDVEGLPVVRFQPHGEAG